MGGGPDGRRAEELGPHGGDRSRHQLLRRGTGSATAASARIWRMVRGRGARVRLRPLRHRGGRVHGEGTGEEDEEEEEEERVGTGNAEVRMRGFGD